VIRGLQGDIERLKAAQPAEPPPWWFAVENILKEYGLQAIDFAADFKKAMKDATRQEPVSLRRGDILRCIETDELCSVWATSTTGKTLVKWSANNFGNYTADQIGELFWLEPAPVPQEFVDIAPQGQGEDYERGFVDGMQRQMRSSVDRAVNRMAQPAKERNT
jgi:hypothetical protein